MSIIITTKPSMIALKDALNVIETIQNPDIHITSSGLSDDEYIYTGKTQQAFVMKTIVVLAMMQLRHLMY